MISNDLRLVILGTLKLNDWEINDATMAAEVPGWDSLNHTNVVLAVERHFGVHFKSLEVLRLKTVGDLQRLVYSKIAKQS